MKNKNINFDTKVNVDDNNLDLSSFIANYGITPWIAVVIIILKYSFI